jgi:hypothetical protein
MAEGDAPEESRWDRLRVRLISIALLIAIVLFLYRTFDDDAGFLTRALPNADFMAMAFFLAPAVMFLIPAAILLRDVRRVRRWPRAPGVVISTGLRSMTHTESAARSHRPVVRYRYTVDGKERQGDTLWVGRTEGGNEGWARSVLARYPVGAQVNVFHDPANPERTSLEAAVSPFGWALLVLGLIFLAIAIYASGAF